MFTKTFKKFLNINISKQKIITKRRQEHKDVK
ncbi:MAG: hypothetical protein UT48_C0018G0026 [Parcubacteria group bacterium GW2011_GWE2_39_37]|nr:MAG: hypothetical protein UT48_C0018G0026 [Parcubacteria group bacterium GW2011_GWE2_39_37]